MTILIINPNTTDAITERLCAMAASLYPDLRFQGATGRFGARYISTRTASVIAAHAALDAYAEHGQTADAVLLACFGDPGLLALRELSTVPVVGLAEAVCSVAKARYGRFAIVTGGERWVAMLWEFLDLIGLKSDCAGVRCVTKTGGQIAENPDAALSELLAACDAALSEDGADVVILAGAGLAGLADTLAPSLSKPILCSVQVGIDTVVAMSRAAFQKPLTGSFALPPPVETTGLRTALAQLCEGRRAG